MKRTAMLLLVVSLTLAACRAPSTVPALPPAETGQPGMERPVQIYFASTRPVLRGPDRLEMVLTMADLKTLAGHSPRAIWIDGAVAHLVDTAWLVERYRQGWPVFVFGEGAHETLLKLLGCSAEKAQPGWAAYRQRGLDGPDVQGQWREVPPVEELLKLSSELLGL